MKLKFLLSITLILTSVFCFGQNEPLISASNSITISDLKNIKPADLADILFTKYGIFTVPIDYANVKGCRITPNIYTNEKELDYFVDSIFEIVSN